MFAGKKRKVTKEIPQWKLDMERSEREQDERDQDIPESALTPSVQDDRPAPSYGVTNDADVDANSKVGEAKETGGASSSYDLPAEDDDDDDEDFDPSVYDIGAGEAEEEEETLVGDEMLAACCVKVTNVAHKATGDDLKTFFEPCGVVIKVLRSVDVRERVAYVSFGATSGARKAVARSGEALHGEALQVLLVTEKNSAGVAPIDELGATRSEQLALLGLAAQPAALPKPQSFAPMPGLRHRLAPSEGAVPSRTTFSKDFLPGQKEPKQGTVGVSAVPKPPVGVPGGGWTVLPTGERIPPTVDPTVGDWRCNSCGNWNWARRKSCNQCKQHKGS